MSAGHAAEFEGRGVTVNVVVPGGPSDTPMVPMEAGFDRSTMVPPTAMVPPILWLCSEAGGAHTGHRYIAANWDAAAEPARGGRGLPRSDRVAGSGAESGVAGGQAG